MVQGKPRKGPKHPLRRRLLDFILRRPGVALRELHEELRQSRGTLRYHLAILARSGALHTHQSGRSLRYYVGDTEDEHKEFLAMLLVGRILEVVQSVRARPGISQRELATTIAMSPKAFRECTRVLVGNRLLEESGDARRKRYYPTPLLIECLERVDRRRGPPGGDPP